MGGNRAIPRVAAERALAAIDADGDLDAQRARIVKHILALREAMSEEEE